MLLLQQIKFSKIIPIKTDRLHQFFVQNYGISGMLYHEGVDLNNKHHENLEQS